MWSHLKRSLATLTKHSIGELTALVKTRLKRMQYHPGLLGGFLASTGLEAQPAVAGAAVAPHGWAVVTG